MSQHKKVTLSNKFLNKPRVEAKCVSQSQEVTKQPLHSSIKNTNQTIKQADVSPRNHYYKQASKKENSYPNTMDIAKQELPSILPNRSTEGNISKLKEHKVFKVVPEMYKACETTPSCNLSSPSYINTLKKKSKPQQKNSLNSTKLKSPIVSQNPLNANNNKPSPEKSTSKRLSPNNTSVQMTEPTIAYKEKEKEKDNDSDWVTTKKENSNYYAISQPGRALGNIPKENQDSFVVIDELLGFQSCSIFGVMDGHGTNGQKVSSFIKQGAIDYFSTFNNYKGKNKKEIVNEACIYGKMEFKKYQYITEFYTSMEEKLKLGKFDVHYSGSTCVMIYLINNRLICSNTGDSRAILVKKNNIGIFEPEQLSKEHKPEVDSEKERISRMGGIVKKDPDFEKEEGISRIWIKNYDAPGIAISRTVGDVVYSKIGVIPEPEIIEKTITNDMCYIVVGSDGIWDFLDNTKVMDIVNPYYINNNPKGACGALIRDATSLWLKADSVSGVRDDITCVVYFLKQYKLN